MIYALRSGTFKKIECTGNEFNGGGRSIFTHVQ